MSDTTLVVLVALAMAVGVAGTVVPLVPGLGLVWLAALAYGLVDGFGVVGSIVFVTISAMAVAGFAAGIAAPHHAAVEARRNGPLPSEWQPRSSASSSYRSSAWRSGECWGSSSVKRSEHATFAMAWRATVGTLKGFGIAGLVQFTAGLLMVFGWVVWVVAG